MSIWDLLFKPDFRWEMSDHLKEEEGYVLETYVDSRGFLSGGVGRKLSNKPVPEDAGGIPLSRATVELWLSEDLDLIERLCPALPYWRHLSLTRRVVVGSMVHQLGFRGLRKFKKMEAALVAKDYEAASDEMLDSVWAVQTPGRAMRLEKMMREG